MVEIYNKKLRIPGITRAKCAEIDHSSLCMLCCYIILCAVARCCYTPDNPCIYLKYKMCVIWIVALWVYHGKHLHLYILDMFDFGNEEKRAFVMYAVPREVMHVRLDRSRDRSIFILYMAFFIRCILKITEFCLVLIIIIFSKGVAGGNLVRNSRPKKNYFDSVFLEYFGEFLPKKLNRRCPFYRVIEN